MSNYPFHLHKMVQVVLVFQDLFQVKYLLKPALLNKDKHNNEILDNYIAQEALNLFHQ